MAKRKKLPDVEYRLEEIFAIEQHFKLHDPDDLDDQEEGRPISFLWDWVAGDGEEKSFIVLFGVWINPVKDFPEEVRVGFAAEFTLISQEPRVPLESFVKVEATTILLPYLREAVASLTGRGPEGAYHLPSFDLAEVLAERRFEETSGGRKILNDVDVARAFGLRVQEKQRGRRSSRTRIE